MAQYFSFPTVSVTEWQFVSAVNEAPVVMTITRNIVMPYSPESQRYNFTQPQLVTESYYVQNSTSIPPFSSMTPAELQRFVYEIRSVTLNFAYINVAAGSFGIQFDDLCLHSLFVNDLSCNKGTMPIMWNISVKAHKIREPTSG